MSVNDGWEESCLLSRLQNGDASAFARLYESYSRSLYINIFRLVKSETEAEEILQDIFVTVWEKRKTIGASHNISGYLFRIAENKVHDFFRKLARNRKLYGHIKDISSGVSVVEEYDIAGDESVILQKAMEILPPQRKKVFYLCKIKGKSYNEVGSLLGISTSTVNDHIVKATHTMREFMLSQAEYPFISLAALFFFVQLHAASW